MPSLVNRVKSALKDRKEKISQNRKIAKQQRLREKTAFEQARRKEAVKLAAKAGKAKGRSKYTNKGRATSIMSNIAGLTDYDPFNFGSNPVPKKRTPRKARNAATIKVNGQTITITGTKRKTKKRQTKKKPKVFDPLDF